MIVKNFRSDINSLSKSFKKKKTLLVNKIRFDYSFCPSNVSIHEIGPLFYIYIVFFLYISRIYRLKK